MRLYGQNFLAWYTAAQWRFIVGGKPHIPVIPTVIPSFELFILISVFFTLAGLLVHERDTRSGVCLAHYDERFSQDRFGIVVYCTERDGQRVPAFLEDSGAEEVRKVEE